MFCLSKTIVFTQDTPGDTGRIIPWYFNIGEVNQWVAIGVEQAEITALREGLARKQAEAAVRSNNSGT